MGFFPPKGLLSLLWLLILAQLLLPSSAVRKSYVVYMGGHNHGEESADRRYLITAAHHEFLKSFVGGKEKAREAIFYSYTKHINGFAAHLEEEEAAELSESHQVISVFPNEMHELHTTRSWEFLGLERVGTVPGDSLWSKARLGEDTIIGVFDTGVWSKSASFNDDGLGPVPTRWKGVCEGNSSDEVICNKKLIGARFYNKGFIAAGGVVAAGKNSPLDTEGHGTHTLATAAGRPVPGANLFGFGNGTAKGGAPSARVAAYKVCWRGDEARGCFDSDILAAFDQAIEDGVDVISLSLGGGVRDYFTDGISIGSFHAVKRGITVVCSAGNSGPSWGTVQNVAPWVITVAASTMDREFTSFAILGNGAKLQGQSLSATSLLANQLYPLISGGSAQAANSSLIAARLCTLGSLDPEKVRGKIVACIQGNVSNVEKGQSVSLAGGVGVIVANLPTSGFAISAVPYIIPGVGLSYEDGFNLFRYINSTTNPVASITAPTTNVGTKPAPFMASFSSRGPTPLDWEILKPDITAPGLNVLAAYTEAAGPTREPFDTRRVKFNIISGTSMSCPHITGIVSLLKTLHPDWSPAAIKSAIMTTATTEDNRPKAILDSFFDEATPLSYGAGHVRPNLAMDPGLVYDLTVEDYLSFLCGIRYNSSQLAVFSGTPVVCPPTPPPLLDFNYPSISVLQPKARTVVRRKLKNVGSPATYTAQVTPLPGISVTVTPETLVFSSYGQEEAFTVAIEVQTAQVTTFGWLTWSDGNHTVRSPIVVLL